MHFEEDLNGFVLFPTKYDKSIKISDVGQTMVYLYVVEPTNNKTPISNLNLNINGVFCGDDMTSWSSKIETESVDEVIKSMSSYDVINGIGYTDGIQVPIISCILVGWSKYSFEHLDKDFPWVANFRSLSSEGRKLYYGMKKLHNEKEIRIITFNKIK